MSKKLVIFGASGHGKVVSDAARRASWMVLGFGDDDAAKIGLKVCGCPVIAGSLSETVRVARGSAADIVVAVGNNEARRRIHENLVAQGVPLATVIHPDAVISETASIGAGSVVFAGVIVNADARVGDNVILNTGAIIEHDNVIGDHAHISPGATLGGTVSVGEETHVGIGATIKNNLSIGARSIVGAGAVVVANIPDDVVAYGCPARVKRSNES